MCRIIIRSHSSKSVRQNKRATPARCEIQERPMAPGSLKTCRKKRDFRNTPEPKGKSIGKRGKKPIFVIHKHAARQLHYDFRLQVGRALKSWAVPKGP